MPNIKGVIAGLAISTALAGGIVSLGAAATTATAGASTVTAGAVLTHCGGGGCGWRRGCGCRHHSCHSCRRHHSCHSSHHRRFRLNVNINNNTVNGARDEVNNTNNNNNV
jgi:hypothetical protein